MIAGQTLTPDGVYRPYLIGVDENGNSQWEAVLNFSILDHLSIAPAGDDGFVIGGSIADGTGNNQAFMMKIGTRAQPVRNLRTGLDYNTIGDAIAAAQAGDTILVDSGTYAGERVRR